MQSITKSPNSLENPQVTFESCPQDSVYETLDGVIFSGLQPLPLPVSGGCAAILDSDRVLFAGGRTDLNNGSFIDVAFIYSRVTNQVEWRQFQTSF